MSDITDTELDMNDILDPEEFVQVEEELDELEQALYIAVNAQMAKKNRTFVSPYEVANIVSQFVGRRVREQQLYNYCANRLIVASKATGSWQIEADSAVEWMAKFTRKHTAS